MEKKEKIALLTEWAVAYKNLTMSINNIESAFGCSLVESDLYENSFKLFELYTHSIAVILSNGKDVKLVEDNLNWYCYENDMGEKKMKAKTNSWKSMREIKDLNILLKLIEE